MRSIIAAVAALAISGLAVSTVTAAPKKAGGSAQTQKTCHVNTSAEMDTYGYEGDCPAAPARAAKSAKPAATAKSPKTCHVNTSAEMDTYGFEGPCPAQPVQASKRKTKSRS
jgi:hypothetical protein